MKTRRILSLLLALLIAVPMLTFTSSADEKTVIAFNEPAIPAIVGETVDFSKYQVEFSDGKAADATFKPADGDKDVTEFKPDKAGVTAFTATNGTDTKTVYVVAKNKDDKEYVLYYNGFDDESSLNDLTAVTSGSLHSVKDGKLFINAVGYDGYRLLLPEWLGDFGNYRIDMSSMVAKTTDTGRWQSIMFRVQSNNYPYYHMCIRQNAAASNGVEFAVRTPANQWDVQSTGSYLESQKANTYYTHTVEAKGNLVKESVNDIMCVWNSTEKAYKSGRVGIQVNYSDIYVDYIKVTLQLNDPERPKADSVILTSAQVKNIVNSVANVAVADTEAVIKNLNDAHSVIVTVNGENVVDKDGKTLFALKDLFENIGNSVIPILYAKTNADADSILSFISSLKTNNDFSIMSDNPDVVKYAREKNVRIRGIIDLTSKYTTLLTAEQISELRLTVNSSLAKTALLDISCLDKETVLQIQSLNVNVWVTDSKDTITATDGVRLLVSGANGVVTNAPSAVAAAYEFFDSKAMTRTPLIIGHRGNPSNAPENSIASYLLAVKNGADIVETDVYLSADNEVVIMHDGDIARTTDGSGNIESMTVEQLKKYHVWADNENFKKQYPDEVIPTLRDMIEALKDTDAKIFIEIKSGKPAICQKIADLIKEYDFSERVCIISFSADQLKNMQKVAPQISCGYLLGGPGSSYTAEEAGEQLYKIINTIQPYNASYNPSSANQSEEFIDACTERGIAVWPWTYSVSGNEAYLNAFRWGYNGLTTNDCQVTANTVRIINASKSALDIKLGETAPIEISSRTYNRTVKDISSRADMVVIEGEGVVSYEKGVFTAESAGTAVVMFKHTAFLPNGERYTLYTSPVTINVSGEADNSNAESDASVNVISDASVASPTTSDDSDSNGWIAIVAVVLLIAVLTPVVITYVKKRGKKSAK